MSCLDYRDRWEIEINHGRREPALLFSWRIAMKQQTHKTFLFALLLVGCLAVTPLMLSSASSQEKGLDEPGFAAVESEAVVAVDAPDDQLVGKWSVRFTGGGVRTYRFDREGKALFVDEEGRSRKKQLQHFGDELLLMDEQGGEVERLTLVDGRLFVEHRIRPLKNGHDFPEQIGIGRKLP
jgi:hypothetical protein